MDQYKEGLDNPFDAPVPGQGLTDNPGNYPWEHPPLYTDTSEAADFVWDRLHRPEFAEQMIAMLDAGIPVEALGRIIIFNGFMEGKWTPDIAFIIAEPIMKMIATMGMKAGVKNIRMSMEDITNKEAIKSIVKTKLSNEDTEKAAMGVKEDIKKIEKKGLMTKPKKEEIA
tara:strand:+ start:517 stop:1026 length:510 start_codon:yes stop_codon:yes gene_type:complete